MRNDQFCRWCGKEPAATGDPWCSQDRSRLAAMTEARAKIMEEWNNVPQVYESIPTEIEAIQWKGTNLRAIQNFARTMTETWFLPLDDNSALDVLDEFRIRNMVEAGHTAVLWVAANSEWIGVPFREWIAKDKHGFYPIKPDVFDAKYKPV